MSTGRDVDGQVGKLGQQLGLSRREAKIVVVVILGACVVFFFVLLCIVLWGRRQERVATARVHPDGGGDDAA